MAAVDAAAQVLESALTETGLRSMLRGLQCGEEVLEMTPVRFLRAFQEMTRGYQEDPEAILAKQFQADADELVILKDIEFSSLCEHHLMPFSGHAHVGYLPEGFVVGISKLARLVECFSRRLQLQERLCSEIAHALLDHLSPAGSAVVIEASHGCLSCRGVRKLHSTFITSAMLGKFRTDPQLRGEFFQAIQLTHSKV